jgi:uncharacterized OB-fold protein
MTTDSRFDGLGPDAVFQQALSEGHLLLQHCEECSAVRFPPALVCRSCASPQLTWRSSPGRGVVYSTTTVRERNGDYNVALIELEGGARMMSKVDGVASDQIRIGQHVQARIESALQPEAEPRILFSLANGGSV